MNHPAHLHEFGLRATRDWDLCARQVLMSLGYSRARIDRRIGCAGEVEAGTLIGGGLSQSLKRVASRVSMDSMDAMRSPDAPKLGSLQEFVSHQGDSSEMGSSRFNAADVHRIGILDLRLYNTDRHAGNLLTSKPASASRDRLSTGLSKLEDAKINLTPIDHGFCLPEALEPPYFEWLHWPQVIYGSCSIEQCCPTHLLSHSRRNDRPSDPLAGAGASVALIASDTLAEIHLDKSGLVACCNHAGCQSSQWTMDKGLHKLKSTVRQPH